MRTVYVFDIDSTLANNDHRAELLSKQCLSCLYVVPGEVSSSSHRTGCPVCGGYSFKVEQASWDKFLDPELVSRDTHYENAVEFVKNLRFAGAPIVYITGRQQKLRDVTEAWLSEHVERVTSEPLYTRLPEQYDLQASVYKEEALKQCIEENGFGDCCFMFFEDDPFVFSMYSKYGTVVKCPEVWDFFCPEGLIGGEPKRRR